MLFVDLSDASGRARSTRDPVYDLFVPQSQQ